MTASKIRYVLSVLLLSIFLLTAAAAFASDTDTAGKFHWSLSHRLTWDDFKGAIPENAPPYIGAITNCGIGYTAATDGATGGIAIKTVNYFDTRHSWFRPAQKTDAVLTHEQGHFDICEIYTRRLRKAYADAHITRQNVHSKVDRIYYEVTGAYRRRQEEYEKETNHGNDADGMQRWLRTITKELDDLSDWADKE